VTYKSYFTKQATKDLQKLSPKLKQKTKDILRNVIAVNPHAGKALVVDTKGYYSVRLTYQDRIVYSREEDRLQILVIRDRTYYGE
jgi:Txe/YoeB family toxin of Txe-Axe toxin-antitoxin module